jgi:hypothetical protein
VFKRHTCTHTRARAHTHTHTYTHTHIYLYNRIWFIFDVSHALMPLLPLSVCSLWFTRWGRRKLWALSMQYSNEQLDGGSLIGEINSCFYLRINGEHQLPAISNLVVTVSHKQNPFILWAVCRKCFVKLWNIHVQCCHISVNERVRRRII